MIVYSKLIVSLIRRLRSVLPLCVTICLLFYYTFQNEIDMLNSYAENEYMPSINNELVGSTNTNSNSNSNLKDKVDEGLASYGNSKVLENASGDGTSTGDKVSHALDLSDPEVLKEKNRYFPLLISDSSKESLIRYNDLPSSQLQSLLLHHKEKYPILYEMSLPKSDTTVSQKNTIIVQNSRDDIQGSTDQDMLGEIRKILLKSLDFDQVMSRATENIEIEWPLKLIDILDTLYLTNEFNIFDEAVALISEVDFTIPPITVGTIDIPDLASRALGGLISAYELSSEEVLLSSAKSIADFILRSFDTPNGLPILHYPWKTQYQNRFPYQNSEIGALSNMALELTRLSQLTKSNKYFTFVYKIYDTISKSNDEFDLDYMFPDHVDFSGCELLTSSEVSKGKHVKGSQVMKSINENFQFVYCQQGGTVKVSPEDIKSKSQLFVMNENTQPVYANIVKMFQMLNYYDIMKIPESYLTSTSTNNDMELENEESGSHNLDSTNKIDNKKNGNSKETPSADEENLNSNNSPSSKKFFINGMNHIKNLMAFNPVTAFEKKLTVISSLDTHSSYVPSKNELRVEMKKHLDMHHQSCSLASTLILGSKLFNITNYADFASEITESCFILTNYFKAAMPAHLYLDDCELGSCQFDEATKLSMIAEGKYMHLNNDEENEAIGDVVTNEKVLDDDAISQKINRLLMFSKENGKSFISVNPSDIDFSTGKWAKQPERPLWVNKMGHQTILSPYTIEPIFYMYRITGDNKWRDMGRELFKTTVSTVKQINQRAKGIWDIKEMAKIGDGNSNTSKIPSSWYSQTLKYYYLLFMDRNKFSLDDYILTSGGHFMKKYVNS
ncbi:hypothetical protein Kpol_1035p35 [Vanderwaltozyma polyspora DSM 70294]|uniref:alpha-1,2-Mannosidase n=1 Tax=Vanderwaltozyma polyspora (strain ATCC 22028 / DSM 70294 / BCRC 21397 / CBS 2163 / NBRC 10782 / NRRL Y-8283 / UCD 57-17) TaxID=436907 RepID=A7TKK0_VANPO|nr:uncharacterized protein Kpol_1035p35 [Vanderwaltozyma polyspora DSM 70294]EDO17222.1 hypothetical protein Kpol_1035p35 [Vanderwaltozyma polyspora DSM 70294]